MKKKTVAIILVLCALLVTLTACFGEKDKEFSKAGMTITLTNKFTEKEIVSQTAYYESLYTIVTCLKEDFSAFDYGSGLALDDYTSMVLENNNLDVETEFNQEHNYWYFSYERTVSGKQFYYFATTFKSNDAFWLIQFACDASNKDKYQACFEKWAGTVTFIDSTTEA